MARALSCHDTIDCIASHPTSQAARARCCTPLRTIGRVVTPPGRVVHLLWPFRGPLAAPSVILCHDTVCCIVTKPGNWAVAHSSSCNFFFFSFFLFIFSFFFSFVHLLENPKKIFIIYIYIFFFPFSSRTK